MLCLFFFIKATPHKSPREPDERFCVGKGVKPQEYFVYFKVLQTHFWRKRSVRIRRRICAVLP